MSIQSWVVALFALVFSGAVLHAEPAASTVAPAAGTTKTFTYKKIGKTELQIVVHYPPDWKATDKRPGIVFFFGGGWTNGSINAFLNQAEYLASRGMVAARADYRVKSRQDVTPKECVQDAKSAIRWFRQNATTLGLDPERIVASGGSAGGHIAACTTLAPGLDEPGEDTGISTKGNAMVLFNPVLRFDDQMSARINNDKALARQISPNEFMDKNTPPTLLLYGTDDALIAHGKEFMEKARGLGIKAELYTAEGQKHGFFNREPWKERTTKRMGEFLESIGYLTRQNLPAK